MARSSSGASTARPPGGASTTVREIDVPADVLRELAACFPERYPVLFDSAADGPLSRTSILVAEPRAALWLDSDGRVGAEGFTPRGASFLEALENWWLSERLPTASAQRFPFNGGWALFLSYEAAQEIEPLLRLPRSSLPWKAFALRVPCALIHDRASNKVFAIAECSGDAKRTVGEEPSASDALDRIEADARAIVASKPAEVSVQSVTEEDPAAYLGRVVRAKEYVRAGEIYQANLSRPWRVELTRTPDIGSLYGQLCRANPAPFAALAQWRGTTILSSSPERLVRINDGHIDTRPIAGTRPRSRRPGDDIAEMTELAAHPKERAEHIMLIDLERNDLGRVSEPGTVRVDELMTIESYAHVHHIVSNVTGELRSDVTPIGALRAVFPGGTITGVPKFRCMQIIAELEGIGRGAYTGSLGFLGRDGSMDMNILIRTLSVQGRTVELRAGGGIVADSDPNRELEETRAKARGMLAAFGAIT